MGYSAGSERVSRLGAPTGERPETVRVWLLGGFRVAVGARLVDKRAWRLSKAAALVKLLALAPGHRLHREQVVDILWPEASRGAATNNLRQTLHVARRTVHRDPAVARRYLSSGDGSLALCPEGDLWVGVEAFERSARTARRAREPSAYEAALDLYAGELLPEDRYEDWAEERRRELKEIYVSLLIGLASAQEEHGDYGSAIETLRTAVSEEPVREEAHAGLMRLLVLSGSKGEALRQYETLRETLSRDLGVEPSASSRALREEIASGGFRPSDRRVSPAEAGVPSLPLHNLPDPRTSLVGREQELVEIKRELAMTRLLSLTGTGGTGKTRLALEIARDLAGAYRDGAWLVELAPLSEAELVPREVASALGVVERPDRPLVDTLTDALLKKELLLVLDNCEHVLEDCGVLTDALLAACPGVRILATSRQPLGISNEAVRPVPPLSVPAADAEGLARHAAVRLFVERARLKLPAFELSPENARAIAQVCRKLEGIPLAIELAAARIDVLTVEQVAERLDRALGLLTGGRVAANRHQTLRAALDWSHELLSESERELFGRLSVFAGGWTLEAAETAGAGDGVAEGEVLELFLGLVDKSLVVASPRKEGGFRYGMLEPVRQYAREKLEESGAEAEATQQRHAMWYLAFAEEAEEGWSGPEHAAWVRRLETEHDNLRAALRWAIDSGEAGLALRLSGALWQFWFEAGHSVEGRGWLEEALSVGGSPAEMAKALNGAGYLTTFQNDYQVAKTQLQEALRLYRQLGDEEGIASALAHLVFYALMGQRGDVDAPKLLGEALALRSRIKDRRTIANVLTLLLIGSIAGMVEEDLREVARLHEEALTGFREAGYVWGIFTCLTNVGLIRLALGELDRAGACFRELLPVSQEADDKVARHHALHGLACVAAAKGDSERAARLWGASEAMQESSGVRLPPITLSFTDYERRLAEARTRLGKTAFDRAWADGEVMTDEEATGYALAVEATAPAPVVSSEQPEVSKQSTAALTNREKEVAALIARGLINRRIAEELHLSERTVTTHVRRILKKLGIRSREQVASRLSD